MKGPYFVVFVFCSFTARFFSEIKSDTGQTVKDSTLTTQSVELRTATTSSNQVLSKDEYQFSENVAESLERGNYFWKRKEIEEALQEFENVTSMDETNIKGLTGIFQCQIKLNRLKEARNTLDTIRRFSLSVELVKNLGHVMDQAEKVQDQIAARDFFTQQMEDFQSATEPVVIATAVAKVTPREALQTNSPRGKFAKAIQLQKKKFTSQAIPLFMEAIMEDQNLLFANDYKLLEDSRSYYQNNVKTDPKDIKSMLILAWIWEQYSNTEEAKKLYTSIQKEASETALEKKVATAKLEAFKKQDELFIRDKIYQEEQLKKDKDRYRKLQISNGKYEGYRKEEYREQGIKYLEAKNYSEAILHLQGATKIEPNNPESHYYYAVAQMESAFNGNENGFAIAKRELEATLALDPKPELRVKVNNLLGSLATEEAKQNSAPAQPVESEPAKNDTSTESISDSTGI